MSKTLKAQVLQGRYKGETVRISNVSADELGRQFAACSLSGGSRVNLPVEHLEVLLDVPEAPPTVRRAQTASMPFISGSSSSRALTHTKNMSRPRTSKGSTPSHKETLKKCETCGAEYNSEERKGHPGKVTQCELCAEETENKMEGTMIFSHKTGATIEIKKDGELKHEAILLIPKGKCEQIKLRQQIFCHSPDDGRRRKKITGLISKWKKLL
jgi:hypothetical protein